MHKIILHKLTKSYILTVYERPDRGYISILNYDSKLLSFDDTGIIRGGKMRKLHKQHWRYPLYSVDTIDLYLTSDEFQLFESFLKKWNVKL